MNTSECKCEACVGACENNPGWMSPGEAVAAMNAGLAKKLMLDWLDPSSEVGNQGRLPVLAPASLGNEGKLAPEMEGMNWLFSMVEWTKGRCTFLSKEGLCEIHESGFKPVQCRSLTHDGMMNNYDAAKLWLSSEGTEAVLRWREETGCDEPLEDYYD